MAYSEEKTKIVAFSFSMTRSYANLFTTTLYDRERFNQKPYIEIIIFKYTTFYPFVFDTSLYASR